METPLSLRIWSPDDYGQSCQVKINWDDSRPYYASFDPNLFGNPLVYNVECRDGYETYRCILNNFVYSTNPSCPVVELRIPSGYAIVRKCDMTTRISPGIVLRNIIYHLTGIYMKNIIGKYKYRDEKHIGFEKSLIEDFIYPYVAVDGWGQHINMVSGNTSVKIKASTSDEIDAVLLAIPLADEFGSYANVIVADFKQGDCMSLTDIKASLSLQRVLLSIDRHDGVESKQEVLTNVLQHLTLSDFGLDQDAYQHVDISLDRDIIFDNIRNQTTNFQLPVVSDTSSIDVNDSSECPCVKVTLYPTEQRVSIRLEPVEKSQYFDYKLLLKGMGELTPQLINSLRFRNEPLNGCTITARGTRLRILRHSSSYELKDLFTLPKDSEYAVESVELRNNTFFVRIEMLPLYAIRHSIERLKTKNRQAEDEDKKQIIKNSDKPNDTDFTAPAGEEVQTTIITFCFFLVVISIIIISVYKRLFLG